MGSPRLYGLHALCWLAILADLVLQSKKGGGGDSEVSRVILSVWRPLFSVMVILSVYRPLFSGCYGDTKCLSATFLRLLW